MFDKFKELVEVFSDIGEDLKELKDAPKDSWNEVSLESDLEQGLSKFDPILKASLYGQILNLKKLNVECRNGEEGKLYHLSVIGEKRENLCLKKGSDYGVYVSSGASQWELRWDCKGFTYDRRIKMVKKAIENGFITNELGQVFIKYFQLSKEIDSGSLSDTSTMVDNFYDIKTSIPLDLAYQQLAKALVFDY